MTLCLYSWRLGLNLLNSPGKEWYYIFRGLEDLV